MHTIIEASIMTEFTWQQNGPNRQQHNSHMSFEGKQREDVTHLVEVLALAFPLDLVDHVDGT
jgi:hypothetical protein